MDMTSFARAGLGALAATMVATAAAAQSPPPDNPSTPPGVFVTPFVSLGSDFSSRVGAGIAFCLPGDFNIEVEVGGRRNEVTALSASVNLLYDLPRLRRVAPYLAAGIGLEQYGVTLDLPRFGVVTQKKVGMSTSLGGGIRVPVTARWDFRSDVRWLNPTGDTPEGWRIYNGASLRIGAR